MERDNRVIDLAFAFTPFIFLLCLAYAYWQRGYFAFGGEYVTLLVPFFVAFVCEVLGNAK